MEFSETAIPDCFIIQAEEIVDQRGAFIKTYNAEAFNEYGIRAAFEESFYSMSYKNVLRGMHFHLPPKAHAKLVYVNQGEIMDVSLDLRKNSPAYGKSVAVALSAGNLKSLYIPAGCAHGFITLSDTALVTYLQETCYSPEHDSGILWSSFGFDWGVSAPIVSGRDQSLAALAEFDSPF